MVNPFWTVLLFTIRTKLQKKTFLMVTAILFILLLLFGNLPFFLSLLKHDKTVSHLGYIKTEPQKMMILLKQYFINTPKKEIHFVGYSATEKMQLAVRKGDIKGFITFSKEKPFPQVIYHSKIPATDLLTSPLQTALQQIKIHLVLQKTTLTPDQKRTFLNPYLKLETQKVNLPSASDKPKEQQNAILLLNYILLILCFLGILFSGNLIASEIAIEKSSRLIETLLISVSPLTLIWGKILGIFVLSLFQMVILSSAVMFNLWLPQNQIQLKLWHLDLPYFSPFVYGYALFFFLSGFLLYSTIFAIIGVIVKRSEALSQATIPVNILSSIGFYSVICGLLANPDSLVIKACQFIPFFTPFILFMRIGSSEPSALEILLSSSILLASIGFLGVLTTKIYRTGAILYGINSLLIFF